MNPQFMSRTKRGQPRAAGPLSEGRGGLARSLYPRLRLSGVSFDELDVELAQRQPLLREVFLDRGAQARPDSLEVFAPPHLGFEIYLGPRTSPGLHADRRTENIRNLLGDRRNLLLDYAAGDVSAIPHAHAPGGRGL